MPHWWIEWFSSWFWYAVVFGYGAIVGSFLNVLIYRMPLGLSVANPPSHCPRCKTKLGFWDNVPLFSFLFLGARCRYCRAPISWRYFGVELLTACLWVALFHRVSGDAGYSWVDFVAQALFAAILVAVIFIDLDHFLIPDELNWLGAALGVARDLICLALIWQAGPWYWDASAREFAYFGWLPRSVVGALVYGSLLFLVSFLTWIYYAREDDETVAQAARRFFADEETTATASLPAPEADTVVDAGTVPPVLPETEERDRRQDVNEAAATGDSLSGGGEEAEDAEVGEDDEEEEESEPPRLRFSPGFLALASALLLIPVVKAWAALAFVLPLLAFVGLTRTSGEPTGAAAARFFRADDGAQGPPTPPDATDDEPSPEAALAADADLFAHEAAEGKHGGMGLGDAKLALAIGAMLGPGGALLSLMVATAAGAVVGVVLARLHGRGLRIGIPFGPFMALGAVLVLLFGDALTRWYLRFAGLR